MIIFIYKKSKINLLNFFYRPQLVTRDHSVSDYVPTTEEPRPPIDPMVDNEGPCSRLNDFFDIRVPCPAEFSGTTQPKLEPVEE